MHRARPARSAFALSAMLAIAIASAHAQQRPPQPGLSPGPGAQAQPPQRGPGQPPQPAPPKPYREIPVTLPQPGNDPSFQAFAKQLRDIAMKKDRAALARVVVGANFFWIGEVNGREGDKANKRKSGMENLAGALGLDGKEGFGWEALADVARQPTLEPMPARQGVQCSPAGPTYDEKAVEQLAKDTGTAPFDWAAPAKPGVQVRASGQPNAPVIGTLGMNLTRVMEEPPPGGNQAQQAPSIRVVMPNGKVGYVATDALVPIAFDQLCFTKDATGWKIAGYYGST